MSEHSESIESIKPDLGYWQRMAQAQATDVSKIDVCSSPAEFDLAYRLLFRAHGTVPVDAFIEKHV